MRLKHRYDLNDVPSFHYGSLFEPAELVGANGSGLLRGLVSGSEAFSYASASGDLDGVDAAEGSGCLLTFSTVLGDLDVLRDPGADTPGGNFSLKRAIFSAAFHESVTFEVVAITDGVETHRQVHTVENQRTRIDLDIRNVDTVTIRPIAKGEILPFDYSVGAYAFYPLMIDAIVTRMATDDPLT